MSSNQDRNHNQLREVTIEPNVNIHSEGSVLVSFGNTKVICSATIEEKVPSFLRGKEAGGSLPNIQCFRLPPTTEPNGKLHAASFQEEPKKYKD